MPPPLSLVLDARPMEGDGAADSRWVRSGCHPNAVLRPIVCGKKMGTDDAKSSTVNANGTTHGTPTPLTRLNGKSHPPNQDGSSSSDEDGATKSPSDSSEPEISFGLFALRDLKASEEIVLGWEWDERHVVHELPRLIRDGYASGRCVLFPKSRFSLPQTNTDIAFAYLARPIQPASQTRHVNASHHAPLSLHNLRLRQLRPQLCHRPNATIR